VKESTAALTTKISAGSADGHHQRTGSSNMRIRHQQHLGAEEASRQGACVSRMCPRPRGNVLDETLWFLFLDRRSAAERNACTLPFPLHIDAVDGGFSYCSLHSKG